MIQKTVRHKTALKIYKVLVASVAHLRPSEAQALGKIDHYRRGDVGFLLYIGDAKKVTEGFEPCQEPSLAEKSEGFKGAIRAARDHGCLYLMLDADGPQLNAVPVYEWQPEVVEDEPLYLNEYKHCGEVWEDQWSCACDDECPICGHDIEPFRSTLISDSGKEHSHAK